MTTKIIRCYVQCEYWSNAEYFEVELNGTETEDEIDEIIRAEALEISRFEYGIAEE